MTVEKLRDMILENIEKNGYANYKEGDEFTAIIIDNYIDIMRLANESNEQLIGIISKDRKKYILLK